MAIQMLALIIRFLRPKSKSCLELKGPFCASQAYANEACTRYYHKITKHSKISNNDGVMILIKKRSILRPLYTVIFILIQIP